MVRESLPREPTVVANSNICAFSSKVTRLFAVVTEIALAARHTAEVSGQK